MNIINTIVALVSFIILYFIGKEVLHYDGEAFTNYLIGVTMLNVLINSLNINDIKRKLNA